jgi:hypothetical protein
VSVRYTNIGQIRRANKDAGRFWFSPDTIRQFASRVETRVYEWTDPRGSYEDSDGWGECRLWIESTKGYDDDQPREYKIARFSVTSHDIGYVGGPDYTPVTHKWDDLNEAQDFLDRVLEGKEQIR